MKKSAPFAPLENFPSVLQVRDVERLAQKAASAKNENLNTFDFKFQ